MLKNKGEEAIKIGVLLPQSKEYPSLSKEFLDGLKLYFTIHDNLFPLGKAELVVEDVGVGSERLCVEKANKLIAQDGVKLISGLLEFNVAKYVGLFTEAFQVPTLIAGLGESTVPKEDLPDNMYFHSLNLWESAFFLGQYHASNPITIITSLYDCGYDALRAFRLGVRTAGGVISEEFTLKSYDEADLIREVSELVELDKGKKYAILLHPNLLEAFQNNFGEQVGQFISFPFKSKSNTIINGRSSNSPVYRDFVDGVMEYLNQEVSVFHCLGYMNGQLLYHSLVNSKETTELSKVVVSAWRNFSNETIWGSPVQTSLNNQMRLPVSFADFYSSQKNVLIESLDDFDEMDIQTNELYEVRNSYTNPYLFF